MSKIDYKIFRDPIHGNIRILPFELNIIDLKIFQRLRCLKQTPSVAYVFHSANHTRFEHSIGSLHIAETYARNVGISDPDKEFLRLCALLHDIAHGIFSHLYDDTIYKEIYPEEKHGHDIHRMKIIRDYIPKMLLETYDEGELRESIESSGLDEYLTSNTKDSVHSIMDMVAETLKSEETVNYNIIHGPLGCDRMDFVKRDSYFSGTGHYGGFPLDRIIQFSSIRKKDNEDILCYSSKILDDIILFLINRFHMYKNVYFHKTCRALDLMLEQILVNSMKSLNLAERTMDLSEFERLNELNFFSEISYYYHKEFDELKGRLSQWSIYSNEKETEEKILEYLHGKVKIDQFYLEIKTAFANCEEDVKNELRMLKDIFKAHKLVTRISERRLFEPVIDRAFTLDNEVTKALLKLDKDFNPRNLAKKAANDRKNELEELYIQGKEEKCPELYIDTPYEIKMSPLEELKGSKIYIYDEVDRKIKSYHEIESERSFKAWDLSSFNIYRIYTTSDTEKEKLEPYISKTAESSEFRSDTSY